MFGIKRWRRARLARIPLTESQRRQIENRVAWIAQLPPPLRKELEGLIQVFLAEKNFEGCGGLIVSDEMRLVIAAQACILLLGRETDVYPEIDTVLLYPRAYVAPARTTHYGIVTESDSVRLGQASRHGSLVLAWDQVAHDASDIHDGHNVVFHEFAHALDFEDGAADGTPELPRSRYIAWARVLGSAYTDLRDRTARHRPSALDAYGATSEAEFFAVATECFFEKPREVEREYPELYEELRLFYRRDPAALQRAEPERAL